MRPPHPAALRFLGRPVRCTAEVPRNARGRTRYGLLGKRTCDSFAGVSGSFLSFVLVFPSLTFLSLALLFSSLSPPCCSRPTFPLFLPPSPLPHPQSWKRGSSAKRGRGPNKKQGAEPSRGTDEESFILYGKK